ncbi:GNAT family N-acetyltransferase [Aquimarina sp. U1-2]|uniref:GNAT family N-acetyltransferase n=1 Tax=Aquimarina sp. U1-2 TaxID=2823141 RepID=UPI001AEC7E7E|nr:GNAT family N-acetyltransferase [Aquimarina sp. U1-2]MBP2833918.1 GNAT family N-acetyltransferase [Aquimarina sp. U1-2]
MEDIIIRQIEPKDNTAIAQVIRNVLIEMGVPKVGTAYEDKELDMMFETYELPKRSYFVVEENDAILGGAGIAPLQRGDATICELQKMYFLPVARGRGIGSMMIHRCLDFASHHGYSKCYLETMPYMTSARRLYKKVGFTELPGPLGDTGHYSCEAWMIKDLV